MLVHRWLVLSPASHCTSRLMPSLRFITGDLGKLNSKGWLEVRGRGCRAGPSELREGPAQVTGRTKEVIKRGGETLSPMEVEEALLKHLGGEFKEVRGPGGLDSCDAT